MPCSVPLPPFQGPTDCTKMGLCLIITQTCIMPGDTGLLPETLACTIPQSLMGQGSFQKPISSLVLSQDF